MKNNDDDLNLKNYWFELPEEQIAQFPKLSREDSKLMVINKHNDDIKIDYFKNILEYLPKKCLIVANNSKVIPARIIGNRKTGGKVEFLLLTPPSLLELQQVDSNSSRNYAIADGLLRSGKPVKVGESIIFSESLLITLLERKDYGKCVVRIEWEGTDLVSVLNKIGKLALPPYIKRNDDTFLLDDIKRYQTVYAKDQLNGSIAAPTAGLHFTKELMDELLASERDWAEITLHVGYGTFSPVRSEDIRNHEMHPEYVTISESSALAINKAIVNNTPIIALGTTSLRTLEGVFRALHNSIPVNDSKNCPDTAQGLTLNFSNKEKKLLTAFSGWINIFIYPGERFYCVDGLITNFHLPESSLLMLVSAMIGRKKALNNYNLAIKNDFRFFSYGDAMLILP